MQILYGFSNCTDKKYSELMSGKNISILRPDQKYHGLLIKGLSSNGAKITCFSGLPINRDLTKKVFIREKDEIESGVYYHYIKTVNLPVFRQLSVFIGSFFGVLKSKKDKNTYIICDCLNIANSYGMMLAGKLKKLPVVTIVTDIPDMMSGSGIKRRINNYFFNSADGFILLTKQMNERVNVKSKPSIVLEGHADSNLAATNAALKTESLTSKKQIVYAGSVCEIYGLKALVEGFLLANIDNCELCIYGDGDYKGAVLDLSKSNKNIKFFGVKENSEVVNAEQKAALLVNPRPSAPEYAKYSFPSKTMEYMTSGTPALTTKLPGIPEEYYPYVYFIDDETPVGISGALSRVLSIPKEVRENKGWHAREFVLKEKSNINQAKKIIEFLREEIKNG